MDGDFVVRLRPGGAIGLWAQPSAVERSPAPGLFTLARPGDLPRWTLSWGWSPLLVLGYALASYWLVERPCLGLKERCTRRLERASMRRAREEVMLGVADV